MLTCLVAASLWLALASARADEPSAAGEKSSGPDEKAKLVARWPEKADAEEQIFDGGQFVALPAAPDLGKGAYSLSVWVYAEDLGGGEATWGNGIARSTRGEQVGDWLLGVHRDGRVRFLNWRTAGNDTGGSHVTAKALVQAGAWHQIVTTWDGTTTRIFVDGVEAEHSPGPTNTGWQTGHEIGRSWTQPGYSWSGKIADFRMYTGALTPAEVTADFKSTARKETQTAIKPAGDPAISAAIDRAIQATLQKHDVRAAPAADDAEFLRRVTLDLAGRIPTLSETEAFLADSAPDKRAKRIEALLAGREMPLYWSKVFTRWLLPPEGRRDDKFAGYLRQGLVARKPWDRFVREMLIARPTGLADQHASFFLSYRKQALQDNTIARDVGRVLFGVNLHCAQCHDHPNVPEWKKDKFRGLSAFFVRSYEHAYTTAPNQAMLAIGERTSGELEYGGSGSSKRIVVPTFLDGKVLEEPPLDEGFKEPTPAKNAPPPTPAFSRREGLAQLGLDPKSPYFKRATVNRVWRQLLGRGLVEPVDMMHEGNPATHPELLDLLANDFAEHGFDLRRLIAVIMQSEAYARSSRWPEQNLPDEKLYAVAVLKPLDADQFGLSVPLATGHYDKQLEGPSKRTMAQLRPVAEWKELIAEFDMPEFEPTAFQALFLLNSDYVQKHFVINSNLVKSLSASADDAELARKAYLAVLCRPPTPEETARLGRYLSDRGDRSRDEVCRELVWALVSGAEFRFNH
jgi:hypothetical protein